MGSSFYFINPAINGRATYGSPYGTWLWAKDDLLYSAHSLSSSQENHLEIITPYVDADALPARPGRFSPFK
jgi:hypothetical protein